MMFCFTVQYDFLEINIEDNLQLTCELLKMENYWIIEYTNTMITEDGVILEDG